MAFRKCPLKWKRCYCCFGAVQRAIMGYAINYTEGKAGRYLTMLGTYLLENILQRIRYLRRFLPYSHFLIKYNYYVVSLILWMLIVPVVCKHSLLLRTRKERKEEAQEKQCCLFPSRLLVLESSPNHHYMRLYADTLKYLIPFSYIQINSKISSQIQEKGNPFVYFLISCNVCSLTDLEAIFTQFPFQVKTNCLNVYVRYTCTFLYSH